MILTISTIVLIIGFIILFLGYLEDNINIGTAGVYIILITLFLGYGILGVGIPVETKKREIENYALLKSKYCTVIATSEKEFITRDISYYNIDRNDIKVYYKKYFDSYNLQIDKSLEVELKKGESDE